MALVLNERTHRSNRSRIGLGEPGFHGRLSSGPMHLDTHARVNTRTRAYAFLSSRPVPLPSHLVPWRLVPCYPVRPEKNIGRSLVNYIPFTMERLYSRIVRPVVNEQRVASRSILRSTRRYYDISILLMYSNALYRV